MVFSWRRFRERATSILHLDEEPRRLAAGLAVGVFIGVTPFYGLHTLLALVAASVFRLNKAATVTGAWINLPWFAPFVYAFALNLGQAILTGDFSSFSWSGLRAVVSSAGTYLHGDTAARAGTLWHYLSEVVWGMLFHASLPLFVGTTLIGAVLGLATYFVALEAVRDVRRLRQRMHPHATARRGPTGGGSAP